MIHASPFHSGFKSLSTHRRGLLFLTLSFGVALLGVACWSPSAHAETQYKIRVKTTDKSGAGTDANVYITLHGDQGTLADGKLDKPDYDDFESGDDDTYTLSSASPIGNVQAIRLRHDNRGDGAGWHVSFVEVSWTGGGKTFVVNRWLATDEADGKTEVVVGTVQEVKSPEKFGATAQALLVKSLDFQNEYRHIRFDKNGFPLHYHSLAGNRWAHLQDMIRLPDSNGRQYYMGTFSQACSDNEGGMVFVAELASGNRGRVIWCDELTNKHPAGGFNHPGDLRRIGNTVVIAGQNWAGSKVGNFAENLPGAYKLSQGKGGQYVLFYDVANPTAPRYAGKVNSCLHGDSQVTAKGEIDYVSAATKDDWYYLSFNGIRCKAREFSATARWELIDQGGDDSYSPVNITLNGGKVSGGAKVVVGDGSDGARVYYNELISNGREVVRKDVMCSSCLPRMDVWTGAAWSLNVLENGRSSIIMTRVESDDEIEIKEVESISEDSPLTYVYVAYGGDMNKTLLAQGFGEVVTDLNRDVNGSNDIHLWYSRNPSLGAPITSLEVALKKGQRKPGFTIPSNNSGQEEGDLNKGAGGADVFLYYSTDPRLGAPIKRVNVMIGENVQAPPGWEMIKADLNKGAGGNYLWLVFSRN